MVNEEISQNSPEEYVRQYSDLRPRFEKFTEKLHKLFLELMEQGKVEFGHIESRTKSIESFSEKIVRPGKSYENPLQEISDLTGIRIILIYSKDIGTVVKI